MMRAVFLLLPALAAAVPAPVPMPKGLREEDRSFFPFTIGDVVLDIQCMANAQTVCSPGGPRDCPQGFRSRVNVGQCGFATLAHYIETGNIAGTCCFKTAAAKAAAAAAQATTTTTQGPQVIVIGVPVHGGFVKPPAYGSGLPGQGQKGSPLYVIEPTNASIPLAQTYNAQNPIGKLPGFGARPIQKVKSTTRAPSGGYGQRRTPAPSYQPQPQPQPQPRPPQQGYRQPQPQPQPQPRPPQQGYRQPQPQPQRPQLQSYQPPQPPQQPGYQPPQPPQQPGYQQPQPPQQPGYQQPQPPQQPGYQQPQPPQQPQQPQQSYRPPQVQSYGSSGGRTSAPATTTSGTTTTLAPNKPYFFPYPALPVYMNKPTTAAPPMQGGYGQPTQPSYQQPQQSGYGTNPRLHPQIGTKMDDALKGILECGRPRVVQQGDLKFVLDLGIQQGPQRSARIVSDNIAAPGEVCWSAAILHKGKYFSGGAVVADKYIITAAHEIYGKNMKDLSVRVGDVNVKQDSLFTETCANTLRVEEIHISPIFNTKNLGGDIAILKLGSKLDLNSDCVCAVCLRDIVPEEGTQCVVSGYGSSGPVDPSVTQNEREASRLAGPNSEILKYAALPVVNNQVCSAALRNPSIAPVLPEPFGVLDNTQICAGGLANRDACYGDGGSPLVCFADGGFYLAGLVSYGRGCAKPLLSAVYANVPAQLPWINSVVNN